jgi:arylsulfatase A-like enzyme
MKRASCQRLRNLGFILAAVLMIVFGTSCQRRPQNIVIVSIDALNRSALKIYDPQGPDLSALDRLAERSVVFDRAYSSASWTLPAHASLLTGLYPDRHGAMHQRRKLSKTVSTLAIKLKLRGFDTVGFTDGGYVARHFGFEKGFDRYDDFIRPGSTWDGPPVARDGRRNHPAGLTLFDRGIEFINAWNQKDRGFFLFLHTYVVHDYFQLHPWTTERLAPYQDKKVKEYLDYITGIETGTPEDWDRLRALYRAELFRMDEGLDRLLKALDDRGLRESTLVVFLSDHGEGFEPARGRIHHGGRLHEDLIRIPMLVAGPGVQPRRSDAPVSLVDVMPTLLDLCGIHIPEELDGRSFAPVLRGKEVDPSRVFYAMEHFYLWDKGERSAVPEPPQTPLSLAVIRGEEWFIRDRQGVELYNMTKDPLQKQNLALKSPSLSEFEKLAGLRDAYRPDAPAVEMDKGLQQQLRSLGYL